MGKLILTRKPGESVKIGNDTILTIREVHPKKVYAAFTEKGVTDEIWMGLLTDVKPFDGCQISIAAISGRQVRLHFEADNSVKIVRTELL